MSLYGNMTESSVVSTIEYRDSATIGKEIGVAAASGDIKSLRELTSELASANSREAQAEVDERNQVKAAQLDPVKQQFVRALERQDGLVDFIRDCGGVLSFSYTLPPEGSEEGALISINADTKSISSATPRAPRAAGSGGGGGRGNVYVVNGQRLALAEAFDAVATEEDKVDLKKRMDAAGTDKSRNSAAWAVKSRVVSKAAEAGNVTVEEKVSE